MNNIEQVYDDMSVCYDKVYVDGEDNTYLRDERIAAEWYKKIDRSGRIVSLGCGTGQDVSILDYPTDFTGYDISEGMLKSAKKKFPNLEFKHSNCMLPIDDQCDILVSIFGTPNYIGAYSLLKHYKRMNAKHAFFVFYNEHYTDGVIETYHRYTRKELIEIFNCEVHDLETNSNYYVVQW